MIQIVLGGLSKLQGAMCVALLQPEGEGGRGCLLVAFPNAPPANEAHTHCGNAVGVEHHVLPGVEGGSLQLKVTRPGLKAVQPLGIHLAPLHGCQLQRTSTSPNRPHFVGHAMPSSSHCLCQELAQFTQHDSMPEKELVQTTCCQLPQSQGTAVTPSQGTMTAVASA